MSLLTPEALRKAADLQEQIVELQNQINGLLGGTAVATVAPVTGTTISTKKGKRHLSPEALAGIRRGQEKRWRNFRKAQKTAQAAQPTAPEAASAPVAPAPPVIVAPPAAAPAPAKSEKKAPVAAKPALVAA